MITSDDIEKEGLRWCMRDNIPPLPNHSVIVYNTDKASGQGKHWETFALQQPICYWYDPFGTKVNQPPKELITWLQKHGYTQLVANEMCHQPLESWLCGWFSIYMAKKMKKHLGHLDKEIFEKYIEKAFDKAPTAQNVAKITQWSKNEGLL
jgi:hypothetical protein